MSKKKKASGLASAIEYDQIGRKSDYLTLKGRVFRVMDFETDPFKQDRIPEPFAVGTFDGYEYFSYWGDDAADWFVDWLKSQPPSFIYAHNGGNFDFMFLREHWRGEPVIINGRITEIRIGDHIMRDSYKILPVKLAEFGGKREIDYDKMEREVREQNRAEILEYLKADCLSLYENVKEFVNEFGLHLTIGSAAIRELNRYYDYDRLSPGIDNYLRQYFYGGRNQCFETGIRKGRFKVFDVNSMYPHVMREFKHPIDSPSFQDDKVGKYTAFITLEARNFGALPIRTPMGLDFTSANGGVGCCNITTPHFHCSIHEYEAGLETGTLEPIRIIRTENFKRWTTFEKFVDMYYAKRIVAKKTGNKARNIFYKLILNNAYGKFATNPENFFDYRITDEPMKECRKNCEAPCGECWEIHAEIGKGFWLWGKPITAHGWNYFNVATGASITGAARAVLLRAIARSKRPLYGDTDSIICESLDADLDAEKLGAWKLEATGTLLAVAGKKTYALFSDTKEALSKAHKKIGEARSKKERERLTKENLARIGKRTYAVIKKASKGVDLTGLEIYRAANGEEIEHSNPVPKFKLSGKTIFTKRTVRRTSHVKGTKIGGGKISDPRAPKKVVKMDW